MTDTPIDRESVERLAQHTEDACKCEYDDFDVSGTLRALLAAKEAAEAEREEAYARGYHDCQQKGITEGRLELIDGPEMKRCKAKLAVAVDECDAQIAEGQKIRQRATSPKRKEFGRGLCEAAKEILAQIQQPKEDTKDDG